MRAQAESASPVRRRSARPVLNAATVALALATVLLALLFVALILVATVEGPVVEAARAVNVASAVGEALSGEIFSEGTVSEPAARVCWFSRRGSCR